MQEEMKKSRETVSTVPGIAYVRIDMRPWRYVLSADCCRSGDRSLAI